MKTKYYIVPVFGCVDPETLKGPFKTYDGMVNEARKIYANQDQDDAIFYLKVQPGRRPQLGTFSGSELD